jgi:hypothetical protein
MKPAARFLGQTLRLTVFLGCTATSCLAAATLTQQIDPPEVNVGDEVTVTITVQNGSVGNVELPPVEGLQLQPETTSTSSFSFVNGTITRSASEGFRLVPIHSGTFTIPAFDIHTQEGDVLHVKPMKLHVVDSGAASATNSAPSQPVPFLAPPTMAPVAAPPHSHGPVVFPPSGGPAPPDSAENPANPSPGTSTSPPLDSEGRPAKVFVVITPETTDAYVGQAVPLRIDWYIREDSDYQQNSLPTIKGSDFLMNNLSVHPQDEERQVGTEIYRCESWLTAISAPKSGDFPLQMERDSYWIKSVTLDNSNSFFGVFSRRENPAHESIPSNSFTMHIHALPAEGRPTNFTGAIGQFKIDGDAQPASVAVGEPVTLHFTVSGEGNFDYVRCPTLPDDPAWKAYVPKSSTNYLNDESRTSAVKTFEQSVIPRKNGSLPLPPASFSYFDPTTKQYVTVPIALPEIAVTGPADSIAPATSLANQAGATAEPDAPAASALLPNRADAGSPRSSLAPVYREPWFWLVQGGLICLCLLGVLFLFLRPRFTPDDRRAERASRLRSLLQEEEAMNEATGRGDILAFFIAARHAVQLQLGAQWNLRPEAVTLDEIRQRDPHLAEAMESLFVQADEVIYSGRVIPDLDLAYWQQHVRTELLQPQPA